MDQGRCRGRRNNVTATTPGGAYVKSNRFAILLSSLLFFRFGERRSRTTRSLRNSMRQTRDAQRDRREVGDDQPARLDHARRPADGGKDAVDGRDLEPQRPDATRLDQKLLKPGDEVTVEGYLGEGRVEHRERGDDHTRRRPQGVRGVIYDPQEPAGSEPNGEKMRRL